MYDTRTIATLCLRCIAAISKSEDRYWKRCSSPMWVAAQPMASILATVFARRVGNVHWVSRSKSSLPKTPSHYLKNGWQLGKRIPPNAIVTSDSGTITTWWARYVPHCEDRSTAVPEISLRWHVVFPTPLQQRSPILTWLNLRS